MSFCATKFLTEFLKKLFAARMILAIPENQFKLRKPLNRLQATSAPLVEMKTKKIESKINFFGEELKRMRRLV